ncbi:hypothetical protein AX15_004810 [Amanita polypyramis BW_CC]|nr:hypothetical protein AX15_004810 [Amanita polypyramis BW_CC]
MDDAAPAAISQDTVRIVLVYISQALPLPPHLLSKPLLQRHYYLNVGPDDYIPYLAWPGPPLERLAEALNGFSFPSDDQCATYPAVYTSHPDAVLAHVRVAPAGLTSASNIRLDFLWDSEGATWKYHNLSLMPFPQDSVSSVDRLTYPARSDMDAASYWGPSDQSDNEVCDCDKAFQSGSDDGYWARYSTVQDSTPSSPPRNQGVRRQAALHGESERIMVSYPMTRTELYNPLEPPSPEQLAHRLTALSVETEKARLVDDMPFETGLDSPTLSPDPLHLSTLAVTPDGMDTKPALACAAGRPSDTLVGDAIRAIYRLWNSSRPEGNNQEAFIEIVRQSIYAS